MNTHKYFNHRIFKILLLFSIFALSSQASAVNGFSNFERVTGVYGKDTYTHQFTVSHGTGFKLTLTDFAFSSALDNVGVTLTSATEEVAEINFGSGGLPSFGYSFLSSGLYGESGGAWGSDMQSDSVNGFLEAGTYFLTMEGSFNNNWYYYQGMQHGLYGVELIATPIPGALLLMSSGLGLLGFMSKKRRKAHYA